MHEEQGVLEEAGAGAIPLSIWAPTQPTRGVVLVGHGLGVDRYHETVQKPARILTGTHQLAVIACDLPLHGLRATAMNDPMEIVDRWQAFWAAGGVSVLQEEWRAIQLHAQGQFPELPIGYFGLSLGTQYGVAFLAVASDIVAAVLGLFGSRPLPLTPVMNACAPRVVCPVYFIQKQQDEIHPLATSEHLFSTLGSPTRTLDSSPGGHTEVSSASLERACAFIATHM